MKAKEKTFDATGKRVKPTKAEAIVVVGSGGGGGRSLTNKQTYSTFVRIGAGGGGKE